MKKNGVKYCIFCGEENDIHNEKCCNKKCKKKFVDDYYDLLYLVVDYYKGDFDGKFFDLLKAILVYLLNTWTYGIVVVFSIIAAATNVIAAINNDPGEEVNYTNESPRAYISSERLANDEETIEDLRILTTTIYDYHKDLDYVNNSLFKDNNLKMKDLDIRTKLALVANKLAVDLWYHSDLVDVYDCDAFTSLSVANKYCKDTLNYVIKNNGVYNVGINVFYDLNKKMISDYYKEVFGEELTEYPSFQSFSDLYCEFDNSTNDYFCFDKYDHYDDEKRPYYGPLIGMIEGRTYTDRIEIDVAYSECNNDTTRYITCYTNDKDKKVVALMCEDENDDSTCKDLHYNGKIKGNLYTLTFIKNDEGNYEWYDIENRGEYFEGDAQINV